MTVNPFLVGLPWQCGCVVPLGEQLNVPGVDERLTVRKTHAGNVETCPDCGARRPTS